LGARCARALAPKALPVGTRGRCGGRRPRRPGGARARACGCRSPGAKILHPPERDPRSENFTMLTSLRIGECFSEYDRHIFRTSFTSHMCVFRACNLCSDQADKHVQGFFIWVSYHDEYARALAARASTQTRPCRPRLVASLSTCPSLFPLPPAHSSAPGPPVINYLQPCGPATPRRAAPRGRGVTW